MRLLNGWGKLMKRMTPAWLQSKPTQTLTVFIPIRGLLVFSAA